MPTPRKGYYTADGARVPSVTTVLSRFKDSGGLIHWAWKEGSEGRDYRDSRDSAASAGTLAHAMVEASIQGLPQPTDVGYTETQFQQALKAFEAYQSWARNSRLEITHTEIQMQSEKYRFGGTPDAIGMLDGKRCLLDWKSGSVYMDALLQVAAYRMLWEENHPDEPIDGGFHIIRFGKETGDFTHRYFTELDDAWTMFQHLRAAYDFDKVLKKRAA